jgi:hypothetical protein
MMTVPLEKYQYWARLRRLKAEWRGEISVSVSFEEYVKATAGIEIIYIEGNISSTYKVIDEHQYLLFKLKYT